MTLTAADQNAAERHDLTLTVEGSKLIVTMNREDDRPRFEMGIRAFRASVKALGSMGAGPVGTPALRQQFAANGRYLWNLD